jgi:hypothetical protein
MTYELPIGETLVARAYVYSGEWVADCPRPPDPVTGRGCGNVEFLYLPSRMNGPRDTRRPFYLCSNCGQQSGIDWPRNEHEILAVLLIRPLPANRNWYPEDHPVAVNFRLEHGQSIADLMEENELHGVDNAPVRGMV